jgi:hypothetical protein
MGFTKELAAEKARNDLAERLNVDPGSVKEVSLTDRDFPDMSLGAATDGEMAAQMISSGWEINLGVNGETYEYRADKYQVRLVGYKGRNYLVE